MYVDVGGFIINDYITHVKITYTGDFTNLPSGTTGYYGIISLDVEDSGGYTTIQQSTNEEFPVSGGLWLNQVTLTKVSNAIITLEADIDYTKIDPSIKRYLISSRLGFKGCCNNPELVTNGTFDTDLSGWTYSGWSWDASGKAKLN